MTLNLNQTARFQAATEVVYGPGTVAGTGQLARQLGMGQVLVVTDGGVSKAGIAAKVVAALTGSGCDAVVYDAVEPNPSIETVEKALVLFHEAACEGVVAVGGGSPIDVAKAVATLATNSGKLSDYIGVGKIIEPLAPLLVVPTTVGTGSEVTTWAVVTDIAQRKKVVLGSPLLAPRVAVLDPELVLTLPSSLTASTGIDALTHAIESVISVLAGPFTDGLALEAIHLIAEYLPAAVRAAELEPRAKLLYASTMAGMAFSYARTALVHGMAHPLSAYYNMPHGLANAILLPGVLAFNLPACEPQLARVAAAMGAEATAPAAVDAVRKLNAQVGIPSRLSDAGVTGEFIPQMARDAFGSGNAQVVNPRKPTYEEIVELYRKAL